MVWRRRRRAAESGGRLPSLGLPGSVCHGGVLEECERRGARRRGFLTAIVAETAGRILETEAASAAEGGRPDRRWTLPRGRAARAEAGGRVKTELTTVYPRALPDVPRVDGRSLHPPAILLLQNAKDLQY